MAAFRYEALNDAGLVTHGVIEADTVRQARARVRELDLTLVAVEAVTQESVTHSNGQRWRFGNGISSAQLSLLTRQLATLLGAGLTIEQALSASMEQSESEAVRQVLAGVRAELLEGHTLALAMSRYGKIFPDIYRALVKAGEASGELDRVMLRLADYTESRQALRQKVGS